MPNNQLYPPNKKEVPQARPDFIVEQPKSLKPETETQAPEFAKEQFPETQEITAPSKTTPLTSDIRPPSSDSHPPASAKSPALIRIENILEENMAEAFKSMDQATQIRFKEEGERTAKKIERLLNQVKIKVKAILDAIRQWLKIIPGVNKHFIEQETKIKGDKMMSLKKSRP